MAKITSNIKKDLYRIELRSATGNLVIADEPVDKGGQDAGFSPKELLASALAACTNATLRMYADRKAWELDEVRTVVELEYDEAAAITNINRNIELLGNLDEGQRNRLLAVANACPVHKILSHPFHIQTNIN